MKYLGVIACVLLSWKDNKHCIIWVCVYS